MESKRTPPASSAGASSPDPGGGDAPGVHLTTFTHEGRFWDVFLKVVEDPADPDSCRARLRFLPADRGDHEEPVETAVVIIEPSYAEALEVARGYDRYHLSAMLRSVT
ncbi:MAG: hypothetical protein F4106_06600 [Gemmatimonadetes bacterium]|nr:hypothetical protein [Gemmatimonadota bacterium]MYC90711.1 hypothetical protein [Gemmatimonadota bacterium]MYG35273.1 hypothetical protein [Gemmatimonadota bacterium]MYJ17703.1 hypothetical protein [Gemmatimonadota bacterium]